jgi:hypothetical protein
MEYIRAGSASQVIFFRPRFIFDSHPETSCETGSRRTQSVIRNGVPNRQPSIASIGIWTISLEPGRVKSPDESFFHKDLILLYHEFEGVAGVGPSFVTNDVTTGCVRGGMSFVNQWRWAHAVCLPKKYLV